MRGLADVLGRGVLGPERSAPGVAPVVQTGLHAQGLDRLCRCLVVLARERQLHLAAAGHPGLGALSLLRVQARLIRMMLLGDLDLVRAEGDSRPVAVRAVLALLVLVAVDNAIVALVLQPLLETPGDVELVRVGIQPAGAHRVVSQLRAVVAVRAGRDLVMAVVLGDPVGVGPHLLGFVGVIVVLVMAADARHVIRGVVPGRVLMLVRLVVHVVLGGVHLRVVQAEAGMHDALADRPRVMLELVVLSVVRTGGVLALRELLRDVVVGGEMRAQQGVPVAAFFGVRHLEGAAGHRSGIVEAVTQLLRARLRSVEPLVTTRVRVVHAQRHHGRFAVAAAGDRGTPVALLAVLVSPGVPDMLSGHLGVMHAVLGRRVIAAGLGLGVLVRIAPGQRYPVPGVDLVRGVLVAGTVDVHHGLGLAADPAQLGQALHVAALRRVMRRPVLRVGVDVLGVALTQVMSRGAVFHRPVADPVVADVGSRVRALMLVQAGAADRPGPGLALFRAVTGVLRLWGHLLAPVPHGGGDALAAVILAVAEAVLARVLVAGHFQVVDDAGRAIPVQAAGHGAVLRMGLDDVAGLALAQVLGVVAHRVVAERALVTLALAGALVPLAALLAPVVDLADHPDRMTRLVVQARVAAVGVVHVVGLSRAGVLDLIDACHAAGVRVGVGRVLS